MVKERLLRITWVHHGTRYVLKARGLVGHCGSQDLVKIGCHSDRLADFYAVKTRLVKIEPTGRDCTGKVVRRLVDISRNRKILLLPELLYTGDKCL